MKRLAWLWLALCLVIAPVAAQPTLEAAAEALREGRAQEALVITNELEQLEHGSFGALYNQGLALRDLGRPARARASFERALVLHPRSLDTRRQLRELHQQMASPGRQPDVRGTPWWTLQEAELLLLVPGVALLGLALAARRRRARLPAHITAVATMSALLLTALIVATMPAERRAVVVEPSAALLAEPKSGDATQKLPAGVMLELLADNDHFVQVRLGNGDTGWLRRAQVAELTLPSRAQSAAASEQL